MRKFIHDISTFACYCSKIGEDYPLLGAEDSDSECHTSSTEDSPQASGPATGVRAPQKRERPRKKPAPQAPRTVAIPVAMPKAPAVIPPRLPPPSQVRAAPSVESEQGKLKLI